MIGIAHRHIATIAGAAALLAAASVAAAEPAQVAAGRRIAQHNCGGCHAVGAGRSPLRDAPPFRQLYHRYKRGDLDQLLQEGQLPPEQMQEEGGSDRHPRMPRVQLGSDEVAALKAFLLSLDPRERRRRP